MSTVSDKPILGHCELDTIISAYNQVTDSLKKSHEQLSNQVSGLREELKRKNDQLRRRERLAALGEMAAGLAHEIRNPLGAIRLFASLLQQDLVDRPHTSRLVEKIIVGAENMEALVADVLAFGRPCDPHPSPVDLRALIAETIEFASAKIAEFSIEVEVSKNMSGVELVTDTRMLQQALLNLLINALEATKSERNNKSRPVFIDLAGKTDDRVTITVSDNGPGIPSDLMDRIFNPFFTTKDSGTGLGLSIVHQIVEALGGSIQAANHCGGGAVFSLCLPKRLSLQ